jgi:transketolase
MEMTWIKAATDESVKMTRRTVVGECPTIQVRCLSGKGRDSGRDRTRVDGSMIERKVAMTKQTETTSTIPPTMQAMWGVNSDSMDSAMKAWSQWFNDCTSAQQESLQFLSNRMSRDVEAATRIATCKSPAEVLDLQFRHTCDAVADYVNETQKLVTLFSRSATSNFAPPSSGAKP